MKRPFRRTVAPLAIALLLTWPVHAQPGPARNSPAPGCVPSRATPGCPPAAAADRPARAQMLTANGDQTGGRVIPPNIQAILADRRIEPITAYLVAQAARRPMEEWTVRQLEDITATMPSLVEPGMPIGQIQALYEFLGLDPEDVFNPRLGPDWQARASRFQADSAAAVAAIASADCQVDPSQMTVATMDACSARRRR